jgi:hypothetical protein
MGVGLVGQDWRDLSNVCEYMCVLPRDLSTFPKLVTVLVSPLRWIHIVAKYGMEAVILIHHVTVKIVGEKWRALSSEI